MIQQQRKLIFIASISLAALSPAVAGETVEERSARIDCHCNAQKQCMNWPSRDERWKCYVKYYFDCTYFLKNP